MAGAGYKLFNTGDVLLSSEVNTYLMQQTVMVFADSAARTTALSGVVAEGMISYLKDTNAVEVYDGSNWVASDDPNAIQNSIVDAKGDLITATADNVPARLAVGSNGDTLLADSSQTTGLRWGDNLGYTAGKNKIINGDFNINQRAFTSRTTDGFGFDRWGFTTSSGGTFSTQAFTLGTAPVAGYESTNFAQVATTGQSGTVYTYVSQKIESVRTLANQSITISFWAKASSGTPSLWVESNQNFGSGGSPSSQVITTVGTATLSTSWTRYSFTISNPSISGKTLGTNNDSFLELLLWTSASSGVRANMSIQTATIQIWGVQVEAGSVATAFQTATGTLQGELAACQRYYIQYGGSAVDEFYAWGESASANQILGRLHFPVKMRSIPTLATSAVGTFKVERSGTAVTGITAVAISGVTSPYVGGFNLTKTSGFTAGAMYAIMANNDLTSYLGWSSEL